MAYIGNTQLNQNYVPAVDFFSGDGSTTAFTLSRPVASVAAIQAVISNVPQDPGTAFTVSGSTITFTSAPPSGTNNIYVYYTSPNTQVVQPGQGTVSPSSLSTGGPYWDTSGNVGIGTSSPAAKLDVSNGAVRLSTAYQVQWFNGATQLGSILCDGGPNLTFQTGSSNTERMRIDSSGNVGIGTSSPNQVLSLKRGAAVGAYIDMAGNNNTLGTNSFLIGQGEDNQAYIYNRYNSNMHFAVNNVEQMTLMAGGDLRFNSGYGSAATAYGCRAWVNFNGTGTVAIRASGNVSSITDNGTGDYTINFTNVMPDANYTVCSTGGQKSGTYRGTMYVFQSNTDAPVNYTTSTCRITSVDPNGANVDSAYCSLSIFR